MFYKLVSTTSELTYNLLVSQLWLLVSLFSVARNLTSLNPALYHFQMTYKITITGIHTHPPPVKIMWCCCSVCICHRSAKVCVCVPSACPCFKAPTTLGVFSHPAFCKLCWGTVLPPILMNVVKLVRRRDPGCFLSGSPSPNLMCRQMMYWKPSHQGPCSYEPRLPGSTFACCGAEGWAWTRLYFLRGIACFSSMDIAGCGREE